MPLKHLIIGSGTVGKATGIWLKANNEDITFNDTNSDILNKLNTEKHKITYNILDSKYDITWICTAEWNVENVLKILCSGFNGVVIIRSTMSPGETTRLMKKYNMPHMGHNPEFLKENTALDDIFNNDRVIIGTNSNNVKHIMAKLYSTIHTPVVFTDPTSSELIKIVSNCWLANQISFWNEVKSISNKLNLNPQEIANCCTLDHRISQYGSNMIGEPFAGFCFPKDTLSFVSLCEKKGIKPILMNAVREVNAKVKQ